MEDQAREEAVDGHEASGDEGNRPGSMRRRTGGPSGENRAREVPIGELVGHSDLGSPGFEIPEEVVERARAAGLRFTSDGPLEDM